MDTLKHPSASVKPDNQASCNVTETAVLINRIVFDPKRLFRALTHNDNCCILCVRARLPLNKKAKIRICEALSTINL
ncbi:MAG: hypothetical protein EOP34_09980 [Rickettsiales bacterium]|jgi:hypothetical protein|nr:MAG: hypothetical protein EOP34_09980 [Rickettsiales bacterium]